MSKYLNQCPEVGEEEIKKAMATKTWGKYKVKETEWMFENREEYWIRLESGKSFIYKNLSRMKN